MYIELGSLRANMDERIKINVSGTLFETRLTTLQRFPDTLLGSQQKRERYFNKNLEEYYFNRHRIAFESILFYYQSNGRLILPDEVPFRVFMDEIIFFELGDQALSSVAQGMLKHGLRKDTPPERALQRKMWDLFEHPDTSSLARFLALFSVSMIVLSIVLSCLESLPLWKERECEKSSTGVRCINSTDARGRQFNSLNNTLGHPASGQCNLKPKEIFIMLEMICFSWFLLEYTIRLLAAPDRYKFLIYPLNIVDLLAICPYFILLIAGNERVVSLAVLRVLRLLRVFRVFKLSRYSGGLRVLCYTLRASLKELEMAMLFVFMIIVLSSSAVYYADLYNPLSQFSSIPDAFWWSLTTVTTVGYGDQIPITNLGRVVGCICAVLGVLAFSLPVMAFAANFNAYLKCEPVRKTDPARERKEVVSRYRKSFRVSS